MWPLLNVRIIESQSDTLQLMLQVLSTMIPLIGMYFALLQPRIGRIYERKNGIHACEQFVKSICQIKDLLEQTEKTNHLEPSDVLFNQSSIISAIDFAVWDKFSSSFGRYEQDKYILFHKIVFTARSAREAATSWEKYHLEKTGESFAKRFRERIVMLNTQIDNNEKQLLEWNIIQEK